MTAASLRRRKHLSRKRTAATVSQTNPELRDPEPEAELRDYIDDHVLAEHKPNEWLHQQVTKEVGLEDAEKFVENLSNVVPVSAKPNTVDETPQHKAGSLKHIEMAVESGLATL